MQSHLAHRRRKPNSRRWTVDRTEYTRRRPLELPTLPVPA